MTYEELLARIDNSDATNNGTGWKLLPIPAALRVVVELHKPEMRYDTKPFCSICYEEGQPYEQANDVYYPCPTIQAIQKELA